MDKEEQIENMKQDWYLEHLVKLANLGVEIGITLSVKGTIISGKMIPNYRYFEILSEQFQTVGGELGKSLSEGSDIYAKEFKQDTEQDTALEDFQVGYIHLSGAKYFATNGGFPESGLLWRGKIEEVDGFTIGSLS